MNHTTHHDDCGCLKAKMQAEIDEMREHVEMCNSTTKNMQQQIKLLQLEKNLNDDYVNFIRFSQYVIDKNGEGVLSFISNNGYIDNPTF